MLYSREKNNNKYDLPINIEKSCSLSRLKVGKKEKNQYKKNVLLGSSNKRNGVGRKRRGWPARLRVQTKS